jgi:hypothetical protein
LKGKGKVANQGPGDVTDGTDSAGSWGLLRSGMWGRLDDETAERVSTGKDTAEKFKDASFDFPLVVLDVDESIPKFKSRVEGDDNEDWEDEAGFYLS